MERLVHAHAVVTRTFSGVQEGLGTRLTPCRALEYIRATQRQMSSTTSSLEYECWKGLGARHKAVGNMPLNCIARLHNLNSYHHAHWSHPLTLVVVAVAPPWGTLRLLWQPLSPSTHWLLSARAVHLFPGKLPVQLNAGRWRGISPPHTPAYQRTCADKQSIKWQNPITSVGNLIKKNTCKSFQDCLTFLFLPGYIG